MRRNRTAILSSLALAALGTLGLAACDVEVPDLNNPGLGELEDNPTATKVGAACTGLLIGTRVGTGAGNGYIAQLGILGREAYGFDPADPRFVSELLEGRLSPASPFGGAFWANPYTNMRLGDIILHATDKVVEFTDEERAAIKGFVLTIRALDLLRVITTRDDIGAVIDTDHPIDEISPIVDKATALDATAGALDEGLTSLLQGGMSFPLAMSGGFAGFTSPSTTFAQFNRAIRVRVAIYQGDYDTALSILDESATFLDDTVTTVAGLNVGVYHSFGTGTGDLPNGLINPNLFAHPSVPADVEDGDQRYARKVVELPVDQGGGTRGLSSHWKYTIYDAPNSPVAIIRNEELVLFRAEARWFTGDTAGATADLNLIRDVSGGLAPIATPASDDEFITALLHERRYSLLFEGHRLIDVRRFDRLSDLPLDQPEGENPATHHINYRWPLPVAECDARPTEDRCALSSQLPDEG